MKNRTYSITSRATGLHLGTYEAASKSDALDALAQEAGYRDHAHACEATEDDGSHLDVTEIVEITPDA
jgi:hypothetical protein